jgi:hypothetical protein
MLEDQEISVQVNARTLLLSAFHPVPPTLTRSNLSSPERLVEMGTLRTV